MTDTRTKPPGTTRAGTGARRRARWPANALLTRDDTYLFREGTHQRLWEKMGARAGTRRGKPGVHFTVWAPASTVP